jgi:hypothetical protein
MAKYHLAIVLAASLAACAQPLVAPRGPTYESKMRTAGHWQVLAEKTADDIVEKLRTVPDNGSATGHILDGSMVVKTLAARPLYLRSLNGTSAFSSVFRDMLSLELTRRGETITKDAAGATVINYGVRVLPYDHPPPDLYVPGSAIVTTGVVLGVAAATAANPIGGAFAAAGAAELYNAALHVLLDQPNAEVVIDIEVWGNGNSLFKSVDFFYIDNADIKFYVALVGGPGFGGRMPPMQTGPAVPAPVPARVMRVSAE